MKENATNNYCLFNRFFFRFPSLNIYIHSKNKYQPYTVNELYEILLILI